MYELLGIYIKILNDFRFQFFKLDFLKQLEATYMEHCIGPTTPTKVDTPLGSDDKGTDANIY